MLSFDSIDARLLVLSAAISLVTGYASFEVIGRLQAARGAQILPWLACGAAAVGSSFWGMQYIGMLAYGMVQHAQPYLAFVAVSRTAAIGVAAVGLWFAAYGTLRRGPRIVATLGTGAGVVVIHFLGIAAVESPGVTVAPQPGLIALTLLLAAGTIALAFAIATRMRTGGKEHGVRLRFAGGAVLGLGIIAVHMSGMAAFRDAAGAPRMPIDPDRYLVAAVAIVSFALALGAIAISIFDRRIRRERERSAALEDLYTRERRLAIAFQRALLPAALPGIPGVRFSTSYVPSTLDDGIGGDWFDAFMLEDGCVALSIGDAAGHGTGAAIAMNIVRQAFRNAAEETSDPVSVMRRANRVLLHSGSASLVTAIFAVLDPTSGDLQYACAGHPPPMCAAADGAVRTLAGTGTDCALGIFAEYWVEAQHTVLPPDALLALYTDGFIEHSRDIIAGMEQLRRALAAQRRDGGAEPARAIDAAIFGTQTRTDDAAILTVQMTPSPDPLDMRLAPIPASAPRARAALRRCLATFDFDEDRRFEILVAAGEAVANAIEHAYSAGDREPSIRLTVRKHAYDLELAIEDAGAWREPTLPTDRGRGISLMRDLADAFALERVAGGTRVRMTFALAGPHVQARAATAVLTPAT